MSSIVFAFLWILFGCCLCAAPKSNIKQVFVIFRHGDRTTDASTEYPRDPHLNETYFPFGWGQLTSEGKQREYDIGVMLRKKYNAFLGSIYFPGEVDATSTDMNRTKASLALVLAGLYPPKNTELDWNPELNWNPIPYNYISYERDLWMTTSIAFCPNYAHMYEQYMASTAGLAITKKYTELFQFLRDNTGLEITTPFQAWMVYSCLIAQDAFKLKLPLWTKVVYPKLLEDVTVDCLNTFVATAQLKQLSGGLMLKRIVTIMKSKIQNTLSPSNLKLHLWSAHDINVAYLAGALNQSIKHSVPYGAYYIIELIEVKGVDCVSIYATDFATQKQVQVKIPGCDVNCPFVQFVSLLANNIPATFDPCGTDLSHVQKYEFRRDYYLGKLSSHSIINHYARIGKELEAIDRAKADL